MTRQCDLIYGLGPAWAYTVFYIRTKKLPTITKIKSITLVSSLWNGARAIDGRIASQININNFCCVFIFCSNFFQMIFLIFGCFWKLIYLLLTWCGAKYRIDRAHRENMFIFFCEENVNQFKIEKQIYFQTHWTVIRVIRIMNK